ncbi:MAG: CinA family nicotinamide mononucleotide deamidase-related protein [Anaerolineales bacterium]|nr:CinA family nicotinamide mononucleotide deamidase-related protein [Anaerolineales bacterium]
MHAELLAIGNELILGETVDTNSAHIARALRTIGLPVARCTVIGDDVEAIAALVREAAARSPIVITTGGLGPTVDDPTRAAVARAFDRALEYRPELWEQIVERFRRFGRTPTENNRQQAYLPTGAQAVENPVGTAPAFVVEHASGVVISLPGVPREMEHLLEARILPYLRERFDLRGVIKSRVIRTVGLGESQIDAEIGELEKLSNPVVGLAAHTGNVDIRITANAGSESEADALIAPIAALLYEKFGEHIYGEGGITLEESVAQMLAARGLTLAIAEAGTQGRLNARLAVLPQAATVYRGASTLNSTSMQDEVARLREVRSADISLALRATASGNEQRIEVALLDGHGLKTHTQTYGGAPTNLGQWASTVALNQLRLRLKRN